MSGITREDVKAFHAEHAVPGNALIVAVRDFKTDEMMAKLERVFGGWKGERRERVEIAPPPATAKTALYLVDKPDSTQSQVRIGAVRIRRKDPDYITVQVANTILGGRFTSRLVERSGRSEIRAAARSQGMFALHHAPLPAIALGGLKLQYLEVERGTAKVTPPAGPESQSLGQC